VNQSREEIKSSQKSKHIDILDDQFFYQLEEDWKGDQLGYHQEQDPPMQNLQASQLPEERLSTHHFNESLKQSFNLPSQPEEGQVEY